MNTLTAHDIQIILIHLKGVDDCFNQITQKSWADLGHKRVQEVRTRLLLASLTDVAVEPQPLAMAAE